MPKERLTALDWMRGAALLVMIETHVVNELLRQDVRQASWFWVVDFANGLVAPSFLFVSGFAFVLASQASSKGAENPRQVFLRRLKRLGTIALAGYAMHFPFDAAWAMAAGREPQQWLRFVQADVLQCLAASQLLLLLGITWIGPPRAKLWWMAATAAGVVALAPAMMTVDFLRYAPAPIAAYLNQQHYSRFPLFPWLAFLFAGAVCASIYMDAARRGRERPLMARILALGAAGAVAFQYMLFTPHRAAWMVAGGKASVLFFLFRLAWVFLVLSGCYALSRLLASLPGFIDIVSRESLFVYVAHLLVLYRLGWSGKTMVTIWRKSLGLWESLAVSLALMALMVVGAKGWSMLKRRVKTRLTARTAQ